METMERARMEGDHALARRYRVTVVCDERDAAVVESAFHEELLRAGFDPRGLGFDCQTRAYGAALTTALWLDSQDRARAACLVARLERHPRVRWVCWATAVGAVEPPGRQPNAPRPDASEGTTRDRLSRWLLAAAAIAGLAYLLFSAHPARAADAPPPPEHTLTANVGLFSEYIFRGISQTGGKPAVQGGFDYAHSSGFYAGTWASNISWLEDFGQYNRSSLEWDFYGGYKNTFPGQDDWNYDVGLYYYYYPGKKNENVKSPNTLEVYGALGWKWVSAKVSYTISNDYFGIRPTGEKTQGTWYWDVSGTYPVPDTAWALIGHVGGLQVRNNGSGDFDANYVDWKLGASYTIPDGTFLKGLEIGAYYTDNNAKEPFYTDLTGYDTSKARGVVYVKKTF